MCTRGRLTRAFRAPPARASAAASRPCCTAMSADSARAAGEGKVSANSAGLMCPAELAELQHLGVDPRLGLHAQM